MTNLCRGPTGRFSNRILDDTYDLWNDGAVTACLCTLFYTAQIATVWGAAGHLRRFRAGEAAETSSRSAKLYQLDAVLDGERLTVAGIGRGVHDAGGSPPRRRARAEFERLLERAAADGARAGDAVFRKSDPGYYARLGFEPIATVDRQLRVDRVDALRARR